MKKLKVSLLLSFIVIASHFLMAQSKMINPSNRKFAHMGESVAQMDSYSVLGAYEDYGNTPYTGAVYVYQNGLPTPHRSYTFDQTLYQYMNIGRHVEITDTWIAASAPNFDKRDGSGKGAIFLAKKVNGQYATTMSYRVDLGGIGINEWGRFSISGSYMVVGTPLDNQKGESAGAAYIYQYSSTTDKWTYLQKITAGDGAAGAQFGYSVGIDGNNIVVGAPGHNGNTGKVYLFAKGSGSTFTQKAVKEYIPEIISIDIYYNSRFGHSVDISSTTIIASAPGNPSYFDDAPVITHVEVMEISGSELVSKGVFRNKGGNAVAIHGNRAVIGDVFTRDGLIHLLKKVNNVWKDYGSYIPCDVKDGDFFGHSVAVSNNNVCAGLKGYDKVNVSLITNEGAGYFINFDTVAKVPVPSASLMNVPAYPSEPRQFLAAEDLTRTGYFGTTMKGDDHGDLLIVGDPEYKTLAKGNECKNGWGAVYIYNKSSSVDSLWKYAYRISPYYDQSLSVRPMFGNHIDYKGDFIKGHTLVVSAENEDVSYSTPGAGAVYVYRKTNYFNEFTFLGRVYHPSVYDAQPSAVKGFGSGGVCTNASHIVVSTLQRKELSLFQVTSGSINHLKTINIGIEGKIQGITEGNIVVVTQGSTIKLYRIESNTLIALSIPGITPNANMQFTGKVSVDQNAMLLVMRQQHGSGNYTEGVLFVELNGLQVAMKQSCILPITLSYGSQPPIREVSLKRNSGFAVALSNGFRVAVYQGAPGDYKLLDIYQLGKNTMAKSTETGFGKSLVYFSGGILVGDPLNAALNKGVANYSCHKCDKSGGFGLISWIPITTQIGFYNGADVYRKPFAVNDGYGPKFGASVCMNANYLLAGASGSNNIANVSGSVTVFKRFSGGLMPVITTLHDMYAAPENAQFGYSMDMGSQYAAISQPFHAWGGRVHIYDLATIENGTPEGVIHNPNASGYGFGRAVASWQNYVAINSTADDKVYVYRKEGAYWVLKQTILAPDANATYGFGESIDMDNNTLLIGDPYVKTPNNTYHGRVYSYSLNTTTGLFSLTSTISPGSPSNYADFGSEVTVSGNYAAIKTTYGGKGKVSVYIKSSSSWLFSGDVINNDADAYGLEKMSFDGSRLLMKSHGNNKVTLYEKSGLSFYKTGTFNVGYGAVSLAQNNGVFAMGCSQYYEENYGKLYVGGRFAFLENQTRAAGVDMSENISGESNDIVLYPNPSSSQWIYVNGSEDVKSVRAISNDGISRTLEVSGNTIDVDVLPKGMYSFIIETSSAVKVKKFIKY